MISHVSKCFAASTAERRSSAAESEKFPAATTPRLVFAGARLDLVEVVGGETARADHDVRAVLERRQHVVFDCRRVVKSTRTSAGAAVRASATVEG